MLSDDASRGDGLSIDQEAEELSAIGRLGEQASRDESSLASLSIDMRLVNEHSSSDSSCGSAGMQHSRYSQFEKRARMGAYSRALARVVRRQIILNAYNRDVALQRRLFESGTVAQLFPGQSILKHKYRWMRENSPQMIKLDEQIIEALQ